MHNFANSKAKLFVNFVIKSFMVEKYIIEYTKRKIIDDTVHRDTSKPVVIMYSSSQVLRFGQS